MSPEEAYAVRSRISALKKFGQGLPLKEAAAAWAKSPKNADQYRVSGWLGEVQGLVKEHFANNPALVALADALTEETTVEGVPPPRDRVREALDLLDTLDAFVFVEPLSGASDGLKFIVEQTLREEYFRNWPFRLVVGAFGLLVVLFFGGTVYLGLQVQGVASQADAARKNIDAARDSVMTATGQAVSRIEEQARHDADVEIQKLRGLIAEFKEAASRLQKDAQGQETALHNAAAEATKTIQNLQADLAARPGQLNELFAKAQQQIQDAVTQAVKTAPVVTNAYLESKKTEIDRAIAEGIKFRIDDAKARIDLDTTSVDGQRVKFEHALVIAQAELPQAAKLADIRAAAFNDTLSRYTGRIDDILNRLSGAKTLTTVEVVASVLGLAFWITLGSIGFSLFAIVVSLLRRRPSVPHKTS